MKEPKISVQLYERLTSFLTDLPIADGHEHYLSPEDFKNLHENKTCKSYVASLLSYLRCDVLAIGADIQLVRYHKSEEECWKGFAPFLKSVRNTSYHKAASLSLRKFYNLEEVPESRGGWMNLAERIKERYQTNWYHTVIKKEMKTKVVSWDMADCTSVAERNPAPDIFISSIKFNEIYHFVCNGQYRKEFMAKHNLNAVSLDALLQFYYKLLETRKKEIGLASIKNSDAYSTGLDIHDVPALEAERIFSKAICDKELTDAERRMWLYFSIFRQAEMARELGLSFQIHTGFQASAYGNYNAQKTDPLLLHDLISKNPRTTFELFHGGFPFSGNYVLMAKMYPNVILNFCWLHTISESVYEETLSHALDLAPYTKIIAFGGDCLNPEAAWGGLQMAKNSAAQVIASKVREGYFCEGTACEILRNIFLNNGLRIWNRLSTK